MFFIVGVLIGLIGGYIVGNIFPIRFLNQKVHQ